MPRFLKIGWLIAFVLTLLLPRLSLAANVDLAISPSNITFSDSNLVEGKSVRIYASIRNLGDTDATAYVIFYQGANLIGRSQIISVLADGAMDDVFVDFKPPAGSFNIRAVIQGAAPEDSNTANNEALTPLYSAAADTDGDGVIDEEDNCSERDNPDQEDLDEDGKGDVCDVDKDGDSVANIDDDFPEDSSKSEEPAPPVVIPAPTPVIEKPAANPISLDTDIELIPPAIVPEAIVAGVEDEQVEPVELALDLSALGAGGSTATSPAARFTYTQTSWKTYEFTAMPPIGQDVASYAWNFGDGATSAQASIAHTFPEAGVYTVSLTMVAADDTVSTDSDDVTVSFFHLNNPLLLLTLGGLIAVLLGLAGLIWRIRKGQSV